MNKIILIALIGLISSFSLAETQNSSLTADNVPVFLDLGFGIAEYEIYDVYNVGPNSTNENAKIYGTQFNLSAMVEKETIHRFKEKIPANAREHALKLNEFAITSIYIPDTLFISPRRDHIQAYGATWGWLPKASAGLWFLDLGVSGGPILTYLNYNDDRESKTIHFFRPGLRGTIFAKVPLFTKYVQLEVGGVGDIYIKQKFYGDESAWNIKGQYAMLHFLIPIEMENPFKDKK